VGVVERFLPKNQHAKRKLLNHENWCSGEMSNIGHDFNNKVMSSKITKLVFFIEKFFEKDSYDSRPRKLAFGTV
jgi:hypothetical protein